VKKKHPLCRPPKGAVDVRRLERTGRFSHMNAIEPTEPGLAFFGVAKEELGKPEDEQQVSVWVANCDCKIHADCPASKALDKACAIYDGASLVRRPKVS
jgi:hypothetical protein